MKYSRNLVSLMPSATLQLTAKAKEMKRSGMDVIALSAGQPDFPTPEPVSEAGIRAIREGKTGYTASTGIPELKTAVAESYSARRNNRWASANVVIGCGAKHCLFNLLAAAVNPGDRVLLPKPYWVSYPEMVKACGGVPVYSQWPMSPDDIYSASWKGATGVMLNFPSNPTGYVPTGDEMRGLADALADTGMWVISDDIYEDLVYSEGGCPHILDFRPDLKERTAVVSGVSKTFSMTGWRIGYSLSNAEWAGLAGTLQAHSTSNPCSISQWASLAALRGDAEADRLRMHRAFSDRRDLVCSLLSGEEYLQFRRPEGAFYVFAELPGGGSVDSSEFCSGLLEEEGLGVIPGSAFGAEGYIRVSFAASEDDIREGVKRLRRFLRRRYDS